MSWAYQQSTGIMVNPARDSSDTGLYSGQPPHVNDGSAEKIHGIGPIPCGGYLMGKAYDHPRLGKNVIPLLPDPKWKWDGEPAHGRTEFFIHGDTSEDLSPSAHPEIPLPILERKASHGCIVAGSVLRSAYAVSPDRKLEVVK